MGECHWLFDLQSLVSALAASGPRPFNAQHRGGRVDGSGAFTGHGCVSSNQVPVALSNSPSSSGGRREHDCSEMNMVHPFHYSSRMSNLPHLWRASASIREASAPASTRLPRHLRVSPCGDGPFNHTKNGKVGVGVPSHPRGGTVDTGLRGLEVVGAHQLTGHGGGDAVDMLTGIVCLHLQQMGENSRR